MSMQLGDLASAARNKKTAVKKKAVAVGAHGLTEEEVKNCKNFFARHDRNNNGKIDKYELCLCLMAMGNHPSDAEVEDIFASLDANGNGTLEFSEFLLALKMQKANERKNNAEQDLIDAFVSLGGKPDKTGTINAELLRKVIKDEYLLQMKIEELIEELDQNNDGLIDFSDFSQLLST